MTSPEEQDDRRTSDAPTAVPAVTLEPMPIPTPELTPVHALGSASTAMSILIVDDDTTYRRRVMRAFQERGFEVRGADEVEQALVLARDESPELALIDLRMPGRSGLELVKELKSLEPSINIVVLTGYGSIATALEAVRLGATHYLTKPADVEEILAAFRRRDGLGDESGRELELGEDQVPSLARVEWEHIHRILTDCGGNISLAARLLGVHRRSLQRKLAKYPVRR